MALNFDIKDPKNQKFLAIVMVIAVILFGFYHFMIKPKLSEIETKKKEVQTLEQTLRTTKKSLKSPVELTAQKEMLDAKYAELEQYLPNDENVALLLDQLSEVEYKAKVYLVGFDATQTIEGDGKPYKANKYRVTIEAGYHQFVDFLSLLMSLPRILSISELRITQNTNVQQGQEKEGEGPADQPRNLSIECFVTSYVFSIAANTDEAGKQNEKGETAIKAKGTKKK